MPAKAELTLFLPTENDTVALAEDVAAVLRIGDVVTLSGGLGAGKTSFARALLRAIADDPFLEVPSPTFTLVQTYFGGRLPVAHFDLYRLSSPEELDEIGFEEALITGAALVEWPERASARMPPGSLHMSFAIAESGRTAVLSGSGPLYTRLLRSRVIREFLGRSGWRSAARRYLQGDASTRCYERIRRNGNAAVLMDWPPSSSKKEPSAIYRAENIRAFLAADEALRGIGLSAPEIYAADLNAGLVLMEDLGTTSVVADADPIHERYRTATDLLAAIHREGHPGILPLPDGSSYHLPVLGYEALAAEADMLLDWYIPHITGAPAPEATRASFHETWQPLLEKAAASEKNWALLDFHSPNVLWLSSRAGLERVGLLDFQDMHVGPIAYDLASLAQDARVTIPPEFEHELLTRYITAREGDPGFDHATFSETYFILAVQRATRILGVFARLAVIGGKPGYLRHVPRLREYLARSLRQPVLSELALWYEKHRVL